MGFLTLIFCGVALEAFRDCDEGAIRCDSAASRVAAIVELMVYGRTPRKVLDVLEGRTKVPARGSTVRSGFMEEECV